MIIKNEISEILNHDLNEYIIENGNLTAAEKKNLRKWVASGNSVYTNPFEISDERGYPMDYIEALRINDEMLEDFEYSRQVDTRRKRRRVLANVLRQVGAIRDAEMQYMENAPENLLGSESYEIAEDAISVLDDVISLLDEVYP